MADRRVSVRFQSGAGTVAALAAAGTMLRTTAAMELQAWELAGAHPNPKLARQILLEYGVGDLGALEPDPFWQKLLEACVRADPENRLRLSQGFPVMVATVGVVEYLSDGVQRLVELLKPREADPLDFACEPCQKAGTAWTCNRVIQASPNIGCDGPDPNDRSNANKE